MAALDEVRESAQSEKGQTEHEKSDDQQRAKLVAHLQLHVLTDHAWSRGRDLLTVATAALEGGATVIQLRNKTASTRVLIAEGLALRALTREHGALLIVNDRVDVALAVDADGVHVGQDDMPAALARRLLGSQRILGVSASTLEEAEEAAANGADYLGIGPIFPTVAKADAGPETGTALLVDSARKWPLPLVAIGGITAENTRDVIQAGATGIAVIRAVVGMDDIAQASRNLRAAVESSLMRERQ
ncbi:MAG TPA: thiamine phosphate synthase [Ktedonobacteraceae bacterium]|nr:thiamine phosphate synthase [Ktedonobacteraceae bacterium]